MFYRLGGIIYPIIILLLAGALYAVYQKARKQSDYYKPFYSFASKVAIVSLVLQVISTLFWYFIHPTFFSLVFGISVNLAFLAFIFPKFEEQFGFNWLRHFFHIGILLTVFVATSFGIYNTADGMELALFIFFCELIGVGGVCVIALIARLFKGKGHDHQAYVAFNAPARSDKIALYREAGLSEQEIAFFREQMATAKEQIIAVEREFNRTAKLKAIETRHNTVKVAKNFFKELVNDPTHLSSASYFLYKLLPSLEDLVEKYNEINGHVAKNKQTYLILEKSAATIEQVCQQINDAYVQFHQSDYEEMLDEIKLANRNLSRTAKKTEDSDTVNDLINDAFNQEELS